ncbi:AAA family ATPase [Nocardioides sp. URHA0020]|uniref:AAA family ATPase n=1 Tax=Nocardioides sp. URHA0020 TaxID=1380392 RepID=UPI0006844019|nr:AAA family ATPase [Nocardioides sp. URHA0020]
MPIVVDPDSGAVAALLATLPATAQGSAHGVPNGERLLRWLDEHPTEYVVVIGPSIPLEEALLLCERLRVTRPALSLVLVRPKLEAAMLTRAMAAGVREVVAVGDTAGLLGSVSRAEELHLALRGPGSAGPSGRIVTVFSPKGGVGKTTLAVNLAVALSKGGTKQVCLVDLDLAFGDVAITLQLLPTHSIEHAIGSEMAVDLPLVQSLLTKHEASIMVLAPPNHPDVRERITALLVSRILGALRTGFDYIVVDTAPDFDEHTLTALDETDECVMVATLDLPTLKNVKIGLATLDSLAIAAGHHHVVLNHADEDTGLSIQQAEEILGRTIQVRMQSSIDVARSTNLGVPIMSSQPDHAVSNAIRGLAAQLAGGTGEPHAVVEDDRPSRRSSRRMKLRR